MKKVLISIFSLSFVLSADSRSPDLVLYPMIAKRCEIYFPEDKSIVCQKTVSRMLANLDYHITFPDDSRSFLFIAFKNKLVKILSEPKTKEFLREVHQRLNGYLLGQELNFNLWETAQSHFGSDQSAAQGLAVLYQDISLKKLHLAYLDETYADGDEVFRLNKEALSRSIDTINLVLDYSKNNLQHLFYPRDINAPLNRNIYHFYVPMALSYALISSGSTAEYAFAAPFLMNLTYEFISSSEDFRYLFQDPPHLKEKWKIQDIFAGYLGANFAVKWKFPETFSLLQAQFETSTEKAVSLMLDRKI